MKKIFKLTAFILLITLCFTSWGCSSCKKSERLSQYDVVANLEGDTLTAKQTFTFYNCYENSFKYLKFNLFGRAFRKDAKYMPVLPQHLSTSYPNGISYGDMEILACYQEGKTLTFSYVGEDQTVLQVDLLREVFPNESAIIVIEYVLKLADVVARTGINDNTINLGNFYPILCAYDQKGFYECNYYGIGDPFYSECADYRVRLTCAKELVVASSGKKVLEQTENDKKTTVFTIDNARSFAMVLSSKFQTISQKVDDTDIIYYYYEDASPKTSLEQAVLAVKLFNEKFGKYPYSTYSVVQTQFVQGGMEYPALVMISDNLESNAYGEVIVHETAHQWWQTVVGNNEIEYGFLDEGLAEYSVVIFFEAYPKYGITRSQMIKSAEQTYKIFCSVTDKLMGKVNTVMLRNLGEFSSEYEYVNLAYIKPCIMYDILRKTVGEERFFGALKDYYEKYSFKNATPYDIVGAFERRGADSNGFFKGFYDGTAII